MQSFNYTSTIEVSRQKAIELKNYLTYFSRKNYFIFYFHKTITKNSKSYILNLFKYSLLAISQACYINTLSKMIKQINQFRISLPQNKIISINDFISQHRAQVQIILSQFKQNLQTKQTQVLELLKNKILAVIFRKLDQNQSDRNEFKSKIQKKIPNFKQVLQRLKQGVDSNQNYQEYFLKLASCSTIYVRQNDLDKLNEDDLQSYLKIRMICNIDKFFPEVDFKDTNFANAEKQRIFKLSIQEKKELIKCYNERIK